MPAASHNWTTHLCPFWWGMCRGSGTQPWQIRDYSNGFCHSVGIRFSYESIYFVSPICACDSHEWGHSAGRNLAPEEQLVEAQCLEGCEKIIYPFWYRVSLTRWNNGAFCKLRCCPYLCYLLPGLLREGRVCEWNRLWLEGENPAVTATWDRRSQVCRGGRLIKTLRSIRKRRGEMLVTISRDNKDKDGGGERSKGYNLS